MPSRRQSVRSCPRTCDERSDRDPALGHDPWDDGQVNLSLSNPGANVESARRLIADAVRGRVVGDHADERASQLFTAPGERWFAEDRPIRIVHADVSMFIGGLRALLFQSLHPLAMAGVAAHSDYRSDPWGRLQRTADFLAATTFGPVTESERAIYAPAAPCKCKFTGAGGLPQRAHLIGLTSSAPSISCGAFPC